MQLAGRVSSRPRFRLDLAELRDTPGLEQKAKTRPLDVCIRRETLDTVVALRRCRPTLTAMALIVSSRLDSLTDRVRLRPVSWDGYARAGLLSQGDVALVQKAQTANLDDDETAQEHASLYVRLLEKLNRNEARAYVLVLVGDLLKGELSLHGALPHGF